MSLVTFNSSCQALRQRLKDIQEAFGNLLGDSDELIQEMASRGVSAVYRLGSEADRKSLLSALMGTLQGILHYLKYISFSAVTKVYLGMQSHFLERF